MVALKIIWFFYIVFMPAWVCFTYIGIEFVKERMFKNERVRDKSDTDL